MHRGNDCALSKQESQDVAKVKVTRVPPHIHLNVAFDGVQYGLLSTYLMAMRVSSPGWE